MNTLARALAATVVLTLTLAACGPGKPVERAGGHAGDSGLTAEVETAIHQDPALRVMPIQVSTYQGVVQLSGSVNRPQMRGLATRVAHGVTGVASVQNDLVVNQP